MNMEGMIQAEVIRKLGDLFPGCTVLKNDPNYIQGYPDLTVMWGIHWAALEVKTSRNASIQPNQEYWVRMCDQMSFGRFIYPENMEEVLNELQQAWRPKRPARVSKRK